MSFSLRRAGLTLVFSKLWIVALDALGYAELGKRSKQNGGILKGAEQSHLFRCQEAGV